ncbi:hypothetical protein NC653_013451 [Populus alba x Populus x berolinensis]|uniref:Uncharacterized protein n=1 Tax=Populus alba x Populus x berolinensis TaxID=444605 RepID=A0AAD6QUL7_9ROSI|nr:hypothetical protein NC653_013451 [Populus alba x Populus x berolinensis]
MNEVSLSLSMTPIINVWRRYTSLVSVSQPSSNWTSPFACCLTFFYLFKAGGSETGLHRTKSTHLAAAACRC